MSRERETRRERQQRAITQHNSPHVPDLGRRKFLYMLGAGTATLLAGGIGMGYRYLQTQTEVDAAIADYQQKETKTEPLIQLFEEGFDAFTNQAQQLINDANLSEKETETIQTPFEIFRINRQNPERNTYLFKRKAIEQSRSLSETQGFFPNQNFFFYDFINLKANDSASFSPPTRTLYLSNMYDSNNMLDNLFAMHELIHVAQDNELKETWPSTTYKAFYSTQERTIGLHEATAYMEEIFMLNLFTQDQFRQDVIKTKGYIDSQKYVTMLHARPEQSGIIDLLAKMAYIFYTSRTSLTGIDSNFLAYINSLYRARGITPYMQTPNGFIVDPN